MSLILYILYYLLSHDDKLKKRQWQPICEKSARKYAITVTQVTPIPSGRRAESVERGSYHQPMRYKLEMPRTVGQRPT
jgi:hypothetical protein